MSVQTQHGLLASKPNRRQRVFNRGDFVCAGGVTI